ncbi:AraC-like ligand-binding domain-containing protein [Actinomadura fibrosa]|uniref:Helix-turn-helix domain-containing protein n=1 Tax=Actinomadura fibrosa TaxID=111802 RepID=A0ABW2XKK4_9ACTN|nr:helix-turn-helix domain-containing protein [Actinomadura fibrosa]
MPTLVSTSDHPAAEQADYWRHLIASAFGPFHLRPAEGGPFAARLVCRTFGAVETGEVRAPAHAVRRGPRQIARDTRECYKLGLVLSGSCVLRQNGRQVRVGAGDVVFYDLTRPVEISFDAHRLFTVVIPHRAVPLSVDRLSALGGTLLTDRVRTGRPMTSLLAALAADAAATGGDPAGDGAADAGQAADEPYTDHLGGAIVELVTGAASEWLGAEPVPCPDRAEMLRAIVAWIEARLHDPALTPSAIAEAHHISVRQLYRVFQPKGTTVARYVRSRRLEHCRCELRDPFLATQRIGAIACRWGMPDAAAFSRAFRAAYGVAPSAYRAAATGLGRAD